MRNKNESIVLFIKDLHEFSISVLFLNKSLFYSSCVKFIQTTYTESVNSNATHLQRKAQRN